MKQCMNFKFVILFALTLLVGSTVYGQDNVIDEVVWVVGDEATSALDNETERAVNEMLLSLMKECSGLTILTIAHRESSLAYCHRVIRLNGKDNGSNL